MGDSKDAKIKRLKAWVDDLHSQMYVNCVYCGHRYGPSETTPVTMADALKAHVEECPEHPMSALKRENTCLRAVAEVAKRISRHCLDRVDPHVPTRADREALAAALRDLEKTRRE